MGKLNHLTERGLETQRELTETLMHLILEKGYDQVSVKDITERAGIDRTTFYLHFKDKQELFSKSQQHLIDDLVRQIPPNAPRFAGVAATFEHMAKHVNQYRVFLQFESTPERPSLLQDYILQTTKPLVEQQLKDHVGADVDVDLIISFMTGAIRSTARWWLQAGMPYSPAEMTERVVRLASRGLSSLINPAD
jgi:AcrR family transcriptional regulator